MSIHHSPGPKNERRKELILIPLLFACAVGLYSQDWFHGLRGGVSTVGAERVLAGEIPYRDFWTMYAPGQFYLLALLYRIFGTHYLVEVVSASVVCAAAACVCYLIAFKRSGHRIAALVGTGIFLAATYHTGYFKNLSTYPPAILFVFTALSCAASYYRSARRQDLLWAGLATGTAIVFKHDVGGYTLIAISAGLIVHHLQLRFAEARPESKTALLSKLSFYTAGALIVFLPVLLYFVVVAGPDMAQDLLVFPLTDFRYARPEGYPSLLPVGIFTASGLRIFLHLFNYLNFALPSLLFLAGLVAIGMAVYQRRPDDAAWGVTLALAYLFHYSAAHVQINTHLISMAVYGALLGQLCGEVCGRSRFPVAARFGRPVAALLGGLLLLSLAIPPAYKIWTRRHVPEIALTLPKVSGVRVSPAEAQSLAELSAFVEASVPPGQSIYIGLHRHDVVIIGDVMLYFILNRPSATRYHELHPAITDTALIQREMIHDLHNKGVPLIVLKDIFSDETLERVKSDFRRNLPRVGATELDTYIRENYVEARKFGPYTAWRRREHGGPAAAVNPPEPAPSRHRPAARKGDATNSGGGALQVSASEGGAMTTAAWRHGPHISVVSSSPKGINFASGQTR